MRKIGFLANTKEIYPGLYNFWQKQFFIKFGKNCKKTTPTAKFNSLAQKNAKNYTLPIHQVDKKMASTKFFVCIDLEMNDLVSKARRNAKGLSAEVIQIGAILLDENFNCIDSFDTYVKPVFAPIAPEINAITGINDDLVKNAPTFTEAFYNFYSWLNGAKVTTFCWSESDYKQLWDEIFIKARKNYEYRDFLDTFVDLQSVFGTLLHTKKQISLDAAMRLCALRFKGERHTAFADAFNTARILYKMQTVHGALDNLPKISLYVEPNLGKKNAELNFCSKDLTTSFASFIDPKILAKYGCNTQDDARQSTNAKNCSTSAQNSTTKENILDKTNCKFIRFFAKKITFIKYKISPFVYFAFFAKMLFTKDLPMQNVPTTPPVRTSK